MICWQPAARCPQCQRVPNVTYSDQEVRRAKNERQAAHVNHVVCPRCGHGYWILAREIAEARPLPNGNLLSLLDFGTAAVLRKAGLTDARAVRVRRDAGTLGDIPGIGAARLAEIERALDGGVARVTT